MNQVSGSPVKDVTMGEALNISLDNYYDLLKTQVGGLKSEEYLQLKLVADAVDISDDKPASEGGYKWFSFHNLVRRSDRAIVPMPIEGDVQVSNETLDQIYGKFLRKLRQFVVIKELSSEDQLKIAEYDGIIERKTSKMMDYVILDRTNWLEFAEAMGFDSTDEAAAHQWGINYGHLSQISTLRSEVSQTEYLKRSILVRSYSDPDDEAIIQAEQDYLNLSMSLRYPNMEDNLYDSGDLFSPEYLTRLPSGSGAQFTDRKFIGWNQSLQHIKTTGAGGFNSIFSKSTTESESITTDWKASASARYGFFKVKASASEHKSIQEDFRNAKSVTLSAKAAFRLNIEPAAWFKPILFEHKYVKENLDQFEEFFGANGSLLYYPTALILDTH